MFLGLSPPRQVGKVRKSFPATETAQNLGMKWLTGWPFFGRPILVCGAPRTGTSWTAKALGLARNLRYVREPISHGGFEEFEQHFRYLVAGENEPDYEAVWRTALVQVYSRSKRWLMGEAQPWLRRFPLWPARLLVKEVVCPLALEWLARRFEMQIVVTLRHPCGYVASGLRLQRSGDTFDPIEYMLNQPRLIADYLVDHYHWLCQLRDPLSHLAAGYGIIYKVVADQLSRHPEWIVVRHEAFCDSPQVQFQRLFESLGLCYSPRVARFLETNSKTNDGHLFSVCRLTADEPGKWKRELTRQQIDTIASIISRFELPFYREFA